MIILIRWFISKTQKTWFVTGVFCGTPGQKGWPERRVYLCTARHCDLQASQRLMTNGRTQKIWIVPGYPVGRDTMVTVSATKGALPILILPRRSCDPFSFLNLSFKTGRGEGNESPLMGVPSVAKGQKYRDNFASCPFPRSLGQSELLCCRADDLGIPRMEDWLLMTRDSDPRLGLCWRTPSPGKRLPWTVRWEQQVGKEGQADGSRVHVRHTYHSC